MKKKEKRKRETGKCPQKKKEDERGGDECF
jgi:hypothetical protein